MTPDTPGWGDILFKHLGCVDYAATLAEMKAVTDTRDEATVDEVWLLEHNPVFTLGMNADPTHVIAAGDIPVIPVDRGGEVTYHGPGQLVVYPLLDLRRSGLGVRALVTALEQSVVELVAAFDIPAASRADAPGVYCDGEKFASVGLRVRRGCSYHGLAINVSMQLEPFSRINPCGYEGLAVTDIATLGGPASVDKIAAAFEPIFRRQLDDAL
jgi:lipoyl(octanoyl) transferase